MNLWSLPSEWKWGTIDDVATIEKKVLQPDDMGEYKQYIGLDNIEKDTGRLINYECVMDESIKSSKFQFDETTILYGKLRPYLNKVYLPDFRGICSTDILVLRPDEKIIDRNYLGAWMRHPVFVKGAKIRSTGANLPRITPTALQNMSVPIPPLDIQRKIVAILDKAEEIKRLRAQANELTQKLLQSVFLEMFGDPITNDKGFSTVSIEDVCNEITVGVVVRPASYYKEKGIPAFRSLNIRQNKLDVDNLVYFSPEDNETVLIKSRLNSQDVVVVRTGYPGTACVIPDKYNGANCIDLIILRPKQELIDGHFLSYFINSPSGQAQTLAGNTGLAQQHLNVKRIRSVKLPLPPLPSQKSFAKYVEHIEGVQQQQTLSKGELDTMLSTLIDKAFTGELVA